MTKPEFETWLLLWGYDLSLVSPTHSIWRNSADVSAQIFTQENPFILIKVGTATKNTNSFDDAYNFLEKLL